MMINSEQLEMIFLLILTLALRSSQATIFGMRLDNNFSVHIDRFSHASTLEWTEIPLLVYEEYKAPQLTGAVSQSQGENISQETEVWFESHWSLHFHQNLCNNQRNLIGKTAESSKACNGGL